jgi:hypothetical protein
MSRLPRGKSCPPCSRHPGPSTFSNSSNLTLLYRLSVDCGLYHYCSLSSRKRDSEATRGKLNSLSDPMTSMGSDSHAKHCHIVSYCCFAIVCYCNVSYHTKSKETKMKHERDREEKRTAE